MRARRAERPASWRLGARLLLVAACLVPVGCGAGAGGSGIAEGEQFLAAWQAGDVDAMQAFIVRGGTDVRAAYSALATDLGIASLLVEPGEATVEGDEGTLPFSATVSVAGLGTWGYEGALAMEDTEDGWRVAWTPAAIHPSLQPGDRLVQSRVAPVRASILAADGRLLAVSDPGGARSRAGASEVVGAVEAAPADGTTAGDLRTRAGDPVGVSGLEATYDRELAGRASGEVRRVDSTGAVVEVLHSFAGDAPEQLQTTIDLTVQQAAVNAVASSARPAAIVAIDATTGGVLAVASGPVGGFDRALNGAYPPGSTFKVVTTQALLANGMDVDTPVDCPAETVAGGRPFRNSGSFGLGQVPFSEAFARSCNTTFVLGAEALPDGALLEAAETFGFNVEYSVGVPAVRGSFPPTESPEDATSAAIGQGRVQASPLHMASVAAAAASGTWRAPWLAPDLEGGDGESIELTDEAAEILPEVMRLVVTEGTGEAANIPNQDVRGKTGTAEFGNEDPLETHAWFIGFRGDLAFAVLVEGGGEEHVAVTGGQVAAPVARTFLDGVPDPAAQPATPPDDEGGTSD
jgi:hypothetical protein